MVEKCRTRAKYSPGVSGMRIRVFQRAPVSASRAISVVWLFGLRVLCLHFTAKADLDRETGALQEISQSPHFDGQDAGSNPGHAATFTEHASLREKWQGASALPSSSNVNFLRDIQGIVHLNAQISDGAFNLRMSKEKLNCSQISGSTIDECSLGSP